MVENTGGALDPSVQGEIDAILDGEVLDSLRAGGPYASAEFIRERLDTFSDAWGGASLRIQSLGEGLLLGRFRLSAKGVGSSVRLYRATRGEAALLRAWHEGGVPGGVPMGQSERWRRGVPSRVGGRGGRTELAAPPRAVADARGHARARVAERGPISRRAVGLPRGHRRGPHHPPARAPLSRLEAGLRWAGGAGGSLSPGPRGGLALAGRQVFNGWHRELQRSATRFFAALAAGDGKTLAELVPDAALRARLPCGLVPEAACDSQNPDTSGTAIVAAAVSARLGRALAVVAVVGPKPLGLATVRRSPVLE